MNYVVFLLLLLLLRQQRIHSAHRVILPFFFFLSFPVSFQPDCRVCFCNDELSLKTVCRLVRYYMVWGNLKMHNVAGETIVGFGCVIIQRSLVPGMNYARVGLFFLMVRIYTYIYIRYIKYIEIRSYSNVENWKVPDYFLGAKHPPNAYC